jgi:hypothetical protein
MHLVFCVFIYALTSLVLTNRVSVFFIVFILCLINNIGIPESQAFLKSVNRSNLISAV